MTQPVKDEDQHDADFEKVSSEQKSLTFSLSYSLVEKAVKIIIVVAIPGMYFSVYWEENE